jgi:hypothetical protein
MHWKFRHAGRLPVAAHDRVVAGCLPTDLRRFRSEGLTLPYLVFLLPEAYFRSRNYFMALQNDGSRDIAVGIATGYGLDGWGVRVRVPIGSRIFSSPRRQDRFWGPPSQLHNGTQTQNKCTRYRHSCLEWDSKLYPSVRESEDSSCLRPRGQCDRHKYLHEESKL